MPRQYLNYNGQIYTIAGWARHLGISRAAFVRRYQRYYPHSPEKVFSPTYLDTQGNPMEGQSCREIKQILQASDARQRELRNLQNRRRKLEEQRSRLMDEILNVGGQIRTLENEIHGGN